MSTISKNPNIAELICLCKGNALRHSHHTLLAHKTIENASWLYPTDVPVIITSRLLSKSDEDEVHYFSGVVSVGKAKLLVYSDPAHTYLGAIQRLQKKLAETVLTKLLESTGEYIELCLLSAIANPLVSLAELTFSGTEFKMCPASK